MNTGQPRVAIYLPSLQVGGAQRVSINIANGLAARGYSVDLLLSFGCGKLSDRVSDTVTIVDLETLRIPIAGIGASVFDMRDYLEEATPAVLISAMTHANIVSLVANRLANTETALVATEHNEFAVEETPKNRLVESLAARAYPTVDHLVAVSNGVARSLVRETAAEREDVSVIYNPIDVDSIRRQARESLDDAWLDDADLDVIFTVGRLERQKDIPTLIEAFEAVHERRPDTRLIVAGRGGERDALMSLAERCGIGDAISFPGYVENPYAYMSRADLFALSSIHEGLPTVLVEALACGCPIVSTDCPSGPREILADGEFGPLVPVGDSTAFAEAILSVLDAPPEPDRLRERATDFGMDVAIDRYVDLIELTVS